MKRITADVVSIPGLGPEQALKFFEWVHRDGYDAEVLLYPRTVMTRALADDEPVMMVRFIPCSGSRISRQSRARPCCRSLGDSTRSAPWWTLWRRVLPPLLHRRHSVVGR